MLVLLTKYTTMSISKKTRPIAVLTFLFTLALFLVGKAEEAPRLGNNAVPSTFDENSTFGAARLNDLQFYGSA